MLPSALAVLCASGVLKGESIVDSCRLGVGGTEGCSGPRWSLGMSLVRFFVDGRTPVKFPAFSRTNPRDRTCALDLVY